MLSVNSIGVNTKTTQNKPSFKAGTYILQGPSAKDAGRTFIKENARSLDFIDKIKLIEGENSFAIKCNPPEYPVVSRIMRTLLEQFEAGTLTLSARLNTLVKPYDKL